MAASPLLVYPVSAGNKQDLVVRFNGTKKLFELVVSTEEIIAVNGVSGNVLHRKTSQFRFESIRN